MSDPLTKTISVPNGTLFREASRDGDEGTGDDMRMSISSDQPYKRYDWMNDEEYWEVLDHGPGGMDDTRLKAGLPVLFNHDRDQHLGLAKSFSNDGKKCVVSGINWSGSEFAQQKKRDAISGALPHTSVGYQLSDDGECIGKRDGIPIYKFKWAPFEASLVTVPADHTVGVGRSDAREIRVRMQNDVDDGDKLAHTRSQKPMATPTEAPEKETPQVDVVKERQDAVAIHKAGVKEIRAWADGVCKNHPEWREAVQAVADRHIDGNAVFSEFHKEVIPALPGARSVDTPHEESRIGVGKKDRKRFSLCKAYLEAHRGKGLTGVEKEICEAAGNAYHGKDSRNFEGLCIPDDITRSDFAEDRDMSSAEIRQMVDEMRQIARIQQRTLNVSNFTAGGALVATDLLGGSMIEILRNAVLIGNGPLAVTELGGLIGNILIPRQTATGTIYWLPEGGAITASDVAFSQLALTPHRMGARSSYTKQLLAQASISVEAFVRNDQMQGMGVEEDRVTINGLGFGGEPLGILNTTGVLSNVTFGGNATWKNIVGLEFGLENANVRTGQMAILTSPQTKSYLKITPKVVSSTFPIFLWEPNAGFPNINGVMAGTVNEYPAYATKNMTTNFVMQGVFSNVFKGRWAGLDAIVNPYTGDATETIYVTLHQWMDIGLRYPQSFNISTDAPTSP